ncbi:hypothetical protein B0J18DRAFT_411099 [Chaetomium sp. MPI-SDFR-AT-0129]|nr:hypothetical protein B0J18DRAFT_411099 [Chaetomium sp. MPI-SDFR-AT-0129]
MALSLRRLLVLSSLSCLSMLPKADAESARIASVPDATDLELASLMHLQLDTPETEGLELLSYSVYPLTTHAGLNQSDHDRNQIWIRGTLVPAEVLADVSLKREETIVFFSCDGENATEMVNEVMGDQPKAILLYSVAGNACSLDGNDLIYNTLYTMGDANEARETMNNTLRAGGTLRATISGGENTTTTTPDYPKGGGNSAAAMSTLYTITGLTTLLFLVIIGTGAVRAHRYPERYGPRLGFGGRPAQSRARGLARAVLETLPIVKFGDPDSAKPDPSLELESQHSNTPSNPDPAQGTRLSAIPEEPQTPPTRRITAPMSGAVPEEGEEDEQKKGVANQTTDSGPPKSTETSEGIQNDARATEAPVADEDHIGCSICTEDFTVGEDVRVLPCNHKFHPPCIDPWLVNVSGTCPLW